MKNQVEKLHKQGLGTSQIAKELGIASSSVSYWKGKLGLKQFPKCYDWWTLQEYYDNGYSYKDLYNTFGVTKRSLQKARNRGVFLPSQRKKPKYYTDNELRGRARESWARYNAAKKYQTPHDANLDAIREFYANCPAGYEVDHIIPISKGGLHSIENLQYLTISENRKKSNKLFQ